MVFNEDTTLQSLGGLLPPNSTLSIGCINGLWTATIAGRATVLTGTGVSLTEAATSLVTWLAPLEGCCPHCGEFDLRKATHANPARNSRCARHSGCGGH